MHVEIKMSAQQFWIAMGVLTLFALALVVLSFFPIPERNDNAFNIALGALLGFGGIVLNFVFPGNVGTQAKDAAIQSLATSASAPLTTTTITETSHGPSDASGVVRDQDRTGTAGGKAGGVDRSDFAIPDFPPGER
ncbi:hypothetical protein Kuura_022 [Caulobacter phage Kuura]|nr:hypothetical protein Kuura_022 [Caulobacter phage Kuura]